MKHFSKLVLLTFFIPTFSFAQSNFKPGYIISLKGDTVKGFIDYKEWEVNPGKVTFKKSIADQPQQFTVRDVNGFGVTGYEYYAKFILSVNKDRTDVGNLSTGPDTTAVIDTLFLKILASGKKINLYTYWDNIKQRFFISGADGVATELVYLVYYDPERASKTIKQNTYKRQLAVLATTYQPGNTALINTIQNAEYDKNDLQHIAVLINGVGENKSLTYANQYGSRFFAGIGFNNSLVKIQGNDDFSGSKSYAFPIVNLGEDFFLNKDIRSFVLRTELSFTANNTSFDGSNSTGVGHTSNLSFKQFIIALSPQLLYNIYNTPETKIYLSAGILAFYSAYSNKSYTYKFTSGFQTETLTLPDLQSIYVTGVAKAGFVFAHKFDVFAGYMPSTNLNRDVEYSLKLSSYQIGVNYLFGK
ncbi:MAG TPA: hypothetical protein VGM63_08235 [Mucilaginibacter sp.]|jgi:hypothetical protein